MLDFAQRYPRITYATAIALSLLLVAILLAIPLTAHADGPERVKSEAVSAADVAKDMNEVAASDKGRLPRLPLIEFSVSSQQAAYQVVWESAPKNASFRGLVMLVPQDDPSVVWSGNFTVAASAGAVTFEYHRNGQPYQQPVGRKMEARVYLLVDKRQILVERQLVVVQPNPAPVIPAEVETTFVVNEGGFLFGLADNRVNHPGDPAITVKFTAVVSHNGQSKTLEMTAGPNPVSGKADSGLIRFYTWAQLFPQSPCGHFDVHAEVRQNGQLMRPNFADDVTVACH